MSFDEDKSQWMIHAPKDDTLASCTTLQAVTLTTHTYSDLFENSKYLASQLLVYLLPKCLHLVVILQHAEKGRGGSCVKNTCQPPKVTGVTLR